MTGASGAPYGIALVQALLAAGRRVDLLLSAAALQVLARECDLHWDRPHGERAALVAGHFQAGSHRLRHFDLQDWNAPIASGSGGARQMVVCPCSMGSLAAMAHGLADNLPRRAADVILKEGGTLILVVRESPLSILHLDNMLRLARAGGIILPASPGFYHRPRAVADLIDFVVARILGRLGITPPESPCWPEGGRD